MEETGKGIVLYNEHIELKFIIAYKSILIKINRNKIKRRY